MGFAVNRSGQSEIMTPTETESVSVGVFGFYPSGKNKEKQ
jgi:hypothetical protein